MSAVGGRRNLELRELASEFQFEVARRGYAVGTAVLQSVLPAAEGPTTVVPIAMGNEGLAQVDGVEAKEVLLTQLDAALHLIEKHDQARILTLGGERAVSVAPFAALANRGDDLAIVWIDSNPDIGTPRQSVPRLPRDGRRRADRLRRPDILNLLPATISPDRVGLVGMHEWTEDDYPNIANWGIQSFSPDELRQSSQPVLDWPAGTGCSRVVLHFGVDTSTATRSCSGSAIPRAGSPARKSAAPSPDVAAAADVVALTIAEFFPRQVLHLQQLLRGFPSSTADTADSADWNAQMRFAATTGSRDLSVFRPARR